MPANCQMQYSGHSIQIFPANALYIQLVTIYDIPAFQIPNPTPFALKRDAHVGTLHSRVQTCLSSHLLMPRVSGLVGYFHQRKLPLTQACVTLCVPHSPTRGQAAPGVGEVCAENPLHFLRGKQALNADPFPVPPGEVLV